MFFLSRLCFTRDSSSGAKPACRVSTAGNGELWLRHEWSLKLAVRLRLGASPKPGSNSSNAGRTHGPRPWSAKDAETGRAAHRLRRSGGSQSQKPDGVAFRERRLSMHEARLARGEPSAPMPVEDGPKVDRGCSMRRISRSSDEVGYQRTVTSPAVGESGLTSRAICCNRISMFSLTSMFYREQLHRSNHK